MKREREPNRELIAMMAATIYANGHPSAAKAVDEAILIEAEVWKRLPPPPYRRPCPTGYYDDKGNYVPSPCTNGCVCPETPP